MLINLYRKIVIKNIIMICPKCGSKIRTKKHICNKCGANIDMYTPLDEKDNNYKEIISIILSIALIIISAFSIIFYWFKGMSIILAFLISITCLIISLFISKNEKEMRFIGRVLDITLLIMAIINIINLYNN